MSLLEKLASKDWRLAAEAAQSLYATGDDGLQVVLAGLSDSRPRIRRAAVDWFDHYGDDRCLIGLTERLLSDPVPKVRRAAVHSLGCDRCKGHPLRSDRAPLLLEVIQKDDNTAVRGEAIFALSLLPADPRVIPALRAVLVEPELDRKLYAATHRALRLHDPEYRRETDAQARVNQMPNAKDAACHIS